MSSTAGSVFKKKASGPTKHQKVVLPSTCTGENSLVLDFSPFEIILQWKRMLECDIFVGARYAAAHIHHKMNILFFHHEMTILFFHHEITISFFYFILWTLDEANIQLLHTRMQFMCLGVTMASLCWMTWFDLMWKTNRGDVLLQRDFHPRRVIIIRLLFMAVPCSFSEATQAIFIQTRI